jgi:hypothetical protein
VEPEETEEEDPEAQELTKEVEQMDLDEAMME